MRPLRVALLGLLPALLPALLCGCLTTYQPLVSLQRPVAIDRRLPNFKGLSMSVRCLPGDNLEPAQAVALCRNVESLFVQQGAVVDVSTQAGGAGEREPSQKKPDLILELGSRVLQTENAGVLWLLFFLTGSMANVLTLSMIVLILMIRPQGLFASKVRR